MVDSHTSERRFLPFFRRYTKTWVHAVATAGLTAFGTLTFVNQGFALVAVAIYVLPPLVLYFRGGNSGVEGGVVSPEHGDGKATEIEPDRDEERGEDNEKDEPEREPERDSNPSREPESSKGSEPSNSPAWTRASTPDVGPLFDAVVTEDGAYAAGEGGVVLRGATVENDWDFVLEDGPGADGADLHGVDTTNDGAAVWVAGDGGALGRVETETDRHTDYSAPNGVTDNWTAVAAAGTAGDETILLANGSGQVLRGRYRDGDLAWDSPIKPGSGSSLCAATLVDSSVGYLCDTNDGVFETTDGGGSFRRIGIENVDGTLTDVAAVEDADEPYATADDGVCRRYADGTWTPNRLGDAELRAISMADELAVVCGGNAVFERENGNEWERTVVPADGDLLGVGVGTNRTVAVGSEGTVVERGRR